jgi:hypothetical protein
MSSANKMMMNLSKLQNKYAKSKTTAESEETL